MVEKREQRVQGWTKVLPELTGKEDTMEKIIGIVGKKRLDTIFESALELMDRGDRTNVRLIRSEGRLFARKSILTEIEKQLGEHTSGRNKADLLCIKRFLAENQKRDRGSIRKELKGRKLFREFHPKNSPQH